MGASFQDAYIGSRSNALSLNASSTLEVISEGRRSEYYGEHVSEPTVK